MDAESLKIILDLKEENILLKQAIANAVVMLSQKKSHFLLKSKDTDINWLFNSIRKLFEEFDSKQKPSESANDSH